MLVALKKRLAPTDYARQLELASKYNKLKVYSKREDVEKWLKDWEIIYTDGTKLSIPEVSSNRSLFDFTHAVSAIDSGFSSTQEYFINQKLRNSETLPDLYDLIEDFRNHYRRTEALKPAVSHSGFATLNGDSSQDATPSRKGQEDTQKHQKCCPCGGNHGEKPHQKPDWKKCEYISPNCRPTGWKGKPETFDKINKMLNSWTDSRVKWFIDTFKYDRLKDSKSTNSKALDTSKGPTTKESDAVGSFITCSSFSSN